MALASASLIAGVPWPRVEIADDPPEVAVAGEILDPGDRKLVPKQRLGGHQHQRLAEFAEQLAAKDVEVIGWGRAVGDLHVVLGAQLEIPLEPGRAVLGALALEAVRKKKHQPAGPKPFELGAGDELVDDRLRAVGKIAELGFPTDQGPRIGERIAIFEAEDPELGQRRVAHFETAPVDRGQRDVFFSRLLVDPNGVTLAERTAAAVLA
jgi:hypothetical protein